jgi:hypothetical protein
MVRRGDARASVDVDEETVPCLPLDVPLPQGGSGQVGGTVSKGVDEELGVGEVSGVLEGSLGLGVGDVLRSSASVRDRRYVRRWD